MELKDAHGAVVARLTLGTIHATGGEIIAHVRKNTVKDPSGNILGYIRHGMVLGPNGEGLALYSSDSLATYSRSSTITFTGTTMKDVAGKILLQLGEDYMAYLEVLIAYIVFFSDLWRDQKHALALSTK